MDSARIVSIILSELSVENLKLQEKLEGVINSNRQIEEKVLAIKDTLKSLAINELMISKFQSMVSNQNNKEVKLD
jgi:hypothetical protein